MIKHIGNEIKEYQVHTNKSSIFVSSTDSRFVTLDYCVHAACLVLCLEQNSSQDMLGYCLFSCLRKSLVVGPPVPVARVSNSSHLVLVLRKVAEWLSSKAGSKIGLSPYPILASVFS